MATLYIDTVESADDLPADIKKLIKSISIPVFDMYDNRAFYRTLPPLGDLYPNNPEAVAKHLYAHFYKVMEMWGSANPTREIFLYGPDARSRSWKIMWEAGPNNWAGNLQMDGDGWYFDVDTSYCAIVVDTRRAR